MLNPFTDHTEFIRRWGYPYRLTSWVCLHKMLGEACGFEEPLWCYDWFGKYYIGLHG